MSPSEVFLVSVCFCLAHSCSSGSSKDIDVTPQLHVDTRSFSAQYHIKFINFFLHSDLIKITTKKFTLSTLNQFICCCWCLVLYICIGMVSSIHTACVVVKTERANQKIMRGPRGAYHPNITQMGNRRGTLPTQQGEIAFNVCPVQVQERQVSLFELYQTFQVFFL